jgi:ubiquinone/menaquinone biosynthesis C-methylase UbiE
VNKNLGFSKNRPQADAAKEAMPAASSQERFGRFAQAYVTSQAHAKGNDLDRLTECAQTESDWIVLDIATGGGHTALRFAPLVEYVIATDITPKMLDAAHRHIISQGVRNVLYTVTAAEDLPFPAQALDLVTCRIAPHHFVNCARFVRESTRVLKSNGLLLAQDHLLPEDKDAARYVDAFERLRDPSHNRGYAESEWVAMFEVAGLKVERVETLVKRHEFLPWAERQACTPQVIEQLTKLVERAPQAVLDWMQPREFGTPGATFANHHLIIAGRKT